MVASVVNKNLENNIYNSDESILLLSTFNSSQIQNNAETSIDSLITRTGETTNSTTGKIIFKTSDIISGTTDIRFELLHGSNVNNASINTNFIFSSGSSDSINDTKFIIINPNASDGDNQRQSRITFRGVRGDNSEIDMVNIEASHSGAAQDNRGQLAFNINDGNDTQNSLQTVMKIGPAIQRSNNAQAGGANTATLAAVKVL